MNALRLCLGTLTVLPVRPPERVDRRVAGTAMVLAPVAALLLGLVVTAVLWLLGYPPGPLAANHAPSPALAAILVVGLLAVLTRGMHLDGLADMADGLGSRKPAAEALDVMRRSDIGPFGVITLVVVLLVQTFAIADQIGGGRSAPAVVLALTVSRLVLPLACLRFVPSARSDGLGSMVAGTVSPLGAAVAAVVAVLGLAMVVVATTAAAGAPVYLPTVGAALVAAVVAVIALAAGAAYCWWCVRRLGGVTGDVLGGCVEVTFTVTLVLLCLV